jgi:uncharacterized protein (DUF885 family)
MRALVLLFFTLFSISILAQSPNLPQQSETARLNSWLNTRYEEELRTSPEELTYLGRRELYDQIGDYSEVGLDKKLELMTTSLKQMKREFDYGKLSPQGKISYDFWDYRVTQAQAARQFRRNAYIFDQFSGVHTSFASLLINYHEVVSTSDMEAYIARIRGSAIALGQLLHRAQRAADEGVRPPRFSYTFVIEESEKLITGAPFQLESGFDSPLWADAKQKISSLHKKDLIDEAEVNRLLGKTKVALLEHWQPAYGELIAWMQSDFPNSDAIAQGVSSLPNGKAYYEHRVALNTQTTMSADDIHAVGLREVARIRSEMLVIKAAVGFTGSLDAFLDFVREDSQFYFPNTDEGRQAYIQETKEYLSKMEQRLPQYFDLLPLAALEVKRVEAFQEQDGAAPYYQESTADGSRPGVYFLHLSDMSAMNITDLETTAYHEGNPGHHLQGAIALERKDLPLFRTIEWYSAYGEGWALYSEYLAKEMGAFENPYYDFGRLSSEMWRAVRLVVDTGIHAKGWSEQRAIEHMLANTASPIPTVRSEIQRYIVAPGQALSYKMGMLKILELRTHAKTSLGDAFDIREFHNVVLDGGSVPLPLLQRAVDDWITIQGQ